MKNYYDILQLAPAASNLVISKVYRVLAAMYHPDNQQTGDEEILREICEAHEVLCDPLRRREYDAKLLATPVTVQESPTELQEGETPKPRNERELRDFILRLLYENRIIHPYRPELGMPVIEAVTGLEIEETEYVRWYLKEKGYVILGSAGDMTITVKGVDYLEAKLFPPGSAAVPEAPFLTALTTGQPTKTD